MSLNFPMNIDGVCRACRTPWVWSQTNAYMYEATCACGPLTSLHRLADHTDVTKRRWYLLMRTWTGRAACVPMPEDWEPPQL
jgi:hypothetical protein